jgi:hypothetical protein
MFHVQSRIAGERLRDALAKERVVVDQQGADHDST